MFNILFDSINVLREENQRLVNKYGITSLSKKYDYIINGLVDYYNAELKRNNPVKVAKQNMILKYFKINLEIIEYDVYFLQYFFTCFPIETFTHHAHFYMAIQHEWNKHSTCVQGFKQSIETYRALATLNNESVQKLRERIEATFSDFPEMKIYLKSNRNLNNFEYDYYNQITSESQNNTAE